MLNSLQLKNFRKHTDAKFDFTAGINVLRGKSEAGKSTLGEAILYAFFGARALNESLDQVVTYDQPENSLKVRLEFTLDSVDYLILRGKSGAELTYADQHVTGQTEVTRFVERLFGCNADVACKLLFATQGSVRGVLEEGGAASNSLVESLSELGMIEDLIDKIQAQLVSGNTGGIDTQIQTLEANLSEVPTEPSSEALETAKRDFDAFSEKIDLLEQAVPGDQEVSVAGVAIEAFNAATARIAKILPLLAGTVTPPDYTEAQLAELRVAQADAPERARKRAAFTTVFPVSEVSWDGDAASYEAAVAKEESDIGFYTAEIVRLGLALNSATMLKINEKSCSFCKKDLTDVPEVAEINLKADEQISQLATELNVVRSKLATAKAQVVAFTKLSMVTAKIKMLAGEYWGLSSTIPPVPTWKGPKPEAEVPQLDLRAIEQQLRNYQTELAKRSVLEVELAELRAATSKDVLAELALIKEHKEAKQVLEQAKVEQGLAERSARELQIRYDAAVQAYNVALTRLEQGKVNIATLRQTRTEMVTHNELVKKLRGIRPQVASQLWGTVLGAISHYFTQIRGTTSTVTKDTAGFKVNGRSVKGLSGSTQDALGLAIRMSLSKLFLPNVPFLSLDESFAGADDSRELNGVGTLSTAGFGQIVMITHSDQPESFADNLIVVE